MKGITFIGMSGAGKSGVGRIVAEILQWRSVDLDQLILESRGMTHHEYMKQRGEKALTELEEKLTLDINLDDTIFSPPGSMIYSPKAMEKIVKESTVVYLQTDHKTIARRLGEKLYKNGIVGLEEKGLEGVMTERIPLYEKYAHYTFVSTEQTKEQMAQEVIQGLKNADVNLTKINAFL